MNRLPTFGGQTMGEFLLAANQDSDTIVSFRIDGESGALEPTGSVTDIPMPVCVRFLV